ncbi:MAG TPA: sodium:solute symporter [Bacteroidia bacterium]|nr:sodium:solute symporter [Bacteroidia bacterium]
MTPALILLCVGIYTLILFGITWWTSRGASNESYFVGDRSSKWYLVAYGMIGASLSGVTFMSVPGNVGGTHFFYFQIILGYFVGYFVIAKVLLPLYYRMNLTSIYTYLEKRLGVHAYKTGAFFFLVSRVLGAACRMFIVVLVLQKFIFDAWEVPFWVTSALFIVLIVAYTFKGGVKTIIWTDTLQTTFMLLSLILSIILIADQLDIQGLFTHITESEHSQVFNTDWKSGSFFPKAFFGGMFISITMTGMDQEMMQKNISCKSIGEAQKNMITFSVVMVIVNILFLAFGVLLWDYVGAHPEIQKSLTEGTMRTDELFPSIALGNLGTVCGLFFIIGLISAAYPSADGALTALTASFCIDFLGFNHPAKGWTEERRTYVRKIVHVAFAVLLFITLLILEAVNDRAIIDLVLFLAAITYGPLLGLFTFGILMKARTVSGWPVVLICIIAPAVCFLLNYLTTLKWDSPFLGGYKFGNELLIINGAITFIGLWIISKRTAPAHE